MSVATLRTPASTQNGGCPRCAGLGTLEATDLFCGAGGSSLGLEQVRCGSCGRQLIRVTQALNHWDLAVEAHNHNFPDADHDLHDVEIVPANRFRRTPLLWASPECTHHAYCRGKKSDDASASRSRMTFYDITRFTAHHMYDAVIVENVIEARLWCDVRGHGKKCNCGRHFDQWYQTMLDLGYEGQIVYFNSQFALPTPQSRDRMYVIFWRNGAPKPQLDFAPASWCSTCEEVVRGIQTWKPASRGSLREQKGKFEWGRYGAQYVYTCPTCHDPVAPAVVGAKTIIDWSMEMTRIGDREKPLADKTRTRIRNGLERLMSTDPVVVQVGGHLYERPGYARVWSVDDPMRAVTGTLCSALVVPVGGQTGQQRTVRDVNQPLGAVTTENHRAVVVRAGGQNGNGRGADEPMQTIVGSDRQVALVVPNRENGVGDSTEEPVRTVTTAPAQHMLVQVNRSGKRGGRRAWSVEKPTPTVAGHGELALVSLRNHGGVTDDGEPAPTVCGGGNHHGVLVYNGNPGFVRDLEDAAGTVTGRDKQALLARPIGDPFAKDREAISISEDDIDDCLFRMLQWQELLAAQQMHLRPDGSAYQLSAKRKNKRGQMVELSNEMKVKMIGNAVSSPVATMLGAAVVDSLAAA